MAEEQKGKQERKDFKREVLLLFIGAVFGLVITLGGQYLSRERRELSIVPLVNTPIYTVNTYVEVANGISLYFKDDLIKSPSIIKYRIKNTGNYFISEDDFLSPISFNFDDHVRILDFSISESSSIFLEQSIQKVTYMQDNNLIMDTFSLSPGEEFHLTIFVDNYITPLTINHRLKNITLIYSLNIPQRSKTSSSVIILYICVTFFSSIVTFRYNKNSKILVGYTIFMIFFAVVIILDYIFPDIYVYVTKFLSSI